MNESELVPLLKVDNAREYRYILPFVPFGVIASVLLRILFNYVEVQMNIQLIYLLSFTIGVFFSEILYYYYRDEYYYFNDKVKRLRGGRVKNIIMYNEIKETRSSKDFVLGGGTGAPRLFYLELEMRNGEFEKLIFAGVFKKKRMDKALVILKDYSAVQNKNATK